MGRAFVVRLITVASVALVAFSGCTVHETEIPGLAGPSELATSIEITATPDHVRQDGESQSTVAVNARGPNGQALAGLGLRLSMSVGGTAQDFGTLSSRNAVTGSDGRATVVYTAPATPAGGGGSGTTIEIIATKVGTNAQTSQSQSVSISLVPPGVILPPAGSPIAAFTYSPRVGSVNVPLSFDASSSTPGSGAISSYAWNFGDGTTGSGRTASHAFASANTFNVTLTVTNDRGLSATTTQTVTLDLTGIPSAAFVFSPSAPQVGQVVSFNAALSTAAAGRTLKSFAWNFGDGVTKTGITSTHDFDRAGVYAVSLTVTDDLDQSNTATESVTIALTGTGPTAPTAAFVFSPTSPQVGQLIAFNGITSAASAGRTITSYAWSFGDGATATGVTASHTFVAPGTYVVSLTVTDNSGERNTVTQSLVFVTAPTAAFVVSPTSPQVGQVVSFNAASSTATAGRRLTSYAWNFGDGATGTSVAVTHSFVTAGTYSTSLTVTDDVGQTDTSVQSVTVSGSTAVLTAEFNFSPTDPVSNDLITFNANLSLPQAAIIAYDWDFGDGTVINGRTSPLISHTYFTAVDATFTARLTVRDSAGGSASVAHTIQLKAGVSPTASFTVSPSPSSVGVTVTLDAVSSTPSSNIVRYTWDFGDGSPIEERPAPTTTTTHAYASVGSKVIRLTVTDTAGHSGSTTRTLLIQ